jgi:hypothetical protein
LVVGSIPTRPTKIECAPFNTSGDGRERTQAMADKLNAPQLRIGWGLMPGSA